MQIIPYTTSIFSLEVQRRQSDSLEISSWKHFSCKEQQTCTCISLLNTCELCKQNTFFYGAKCIRDAYLSCFLFFSSLLLLAIDIHELQILKSITIVLHCGFGKLLLDTPRNSFTNPRKLSFPSVCLIQS